jgi:LuxR family transcriptional regulator, maltose regulon positive regulatory protein
LRKLGLFYDDLFQELDQKADPSPPMFFTLMQARYALLLYEWNRLPEAERALQRSREIMANVTAPMVAFVSLLNLWTQTRIALARGDREEAGHLLERVKFNETTLQTAEQGQRLLGAILARVALACGQLEPALRCVGLCGLRFDDSATLQPAISGYFDYLTLARVLLVQGRDPRNGSRLVQAALLLKRLRDLTVEKGWQGKLREIEMLMALVLQAQGKTKRALTILGSALAQAEAEGYVRLFADEGQPMEHLLAQVVAYTTASPGYIQRIQAALAPIQLGSLDLPCTASRQALPDPLSPREQEVLQLVARGFSNQQIADHLVISLNTAKRHVKHVLAKLVVTNRTQALARARELHLL